MGPPLEEVRLKRALDDFAFWFLDGFFAEPLRRVLLIAHRLVERTARQLEDIGAPTTDDEHAMVRMKKLAFAGRAGWMGRVYAELRRVCGVAGASDNPRSWTREQRTRILVFTIAFAKRLELEHGYIRHKSLLFRSRNADGSPATERDLQSVSLADVERIQRENAEELGPEIVFRWAQNAPRVKEELLFCRFEPLPFGASIRAADLYNALGKQRQFMKAHENGKHVPPERLDPNKLVIVRVEGPRKAKLYSRESVLRWLVSFGGLLQLVPKLDDLCRPPNAPAAAPPPA